VRASVLVGLFKLQSWLPRTTCKGAMFFSLWNIVAVTLTHYGDMFVLV
jgi:hypothetical protein